MVTPLKSKSILLAEIRKTMRRTGVSETQLGKHLSMSQSGVSKLLRGKRRLSYSGADNITSFLISKIALLPPYASADEKAVKEEKLSWAYSDERLCDVAERMFKNGFSQLPVRNKTDNVFMGVITELSILNRMMMPGEDSTEDLNNWCKSRIDETDVIEDIVSLPHDTPLVEVAEYLLRTPAVLLTKLGAIVGLHTRADTLRYMWEDNS